MALPTIPTLTPHDDRANADARAFRRALKLFHEAARRVPAYRLFLKKAKIRPELIRTRVTCRTKGTRITPDIFTIRANGTSGFCIVHD